ncbi:hypothetical protein [Microbacterium testaceum]|uniref:hypothetical protein n=1 Tax=Microbacterium testaceum TaxID=2033 RepID=UPI002AC3E8D8|nr:hypothetical protein [Microbacterium testaceum]MDZ5146334.1 hypothetical protein [Microbacterium testaceum]
MAKTHSDLERLFPFTGKPGILLAEYVRAGPQGIDITGAGRRAGLSYATANRATAVLVDSGLVAATDWGAYVFNLEAPHSQLALDAVWTATGHKYRHEPSTWADTPAWDGGVANLDVRDTVLLRRMPAPLLRRGQTVAGAAVDVPGPSALEARSFALTIQRVVGSSLLLLVDTLQEPYALWHVERDRNLIHKTLHLGTGVYAATSALTTHDDENTADATVNAIRWVHAAYALAGETRYVEELITELAHVADLMNLAEEIARQVEDARAYLERATNDDALIDAPSDRILAEYRGRLERAEARQDLVEHVLRAAHGRGDLGYSSARLLFGTLDHYHRIIARLAHHALQHPCVHQWIEAYQNAAAQGTQEPVDFDDYPAPADEQLPRHTRLTVDDVDAALDGSPGPLFTPFMTVTSTQHAAR